MCRSWVVHFAVMDDSHLCFAFLGAENLIEYIKARCTRIPEASSNATRNTFWLFHLQSTLPMRFSKTVKSDKETAMDRDATRNISHILKSSKLSLKGGWAHFCQWYRYYQSRCVGFAVLLSQLSIVEICDNLLSKRPQVQLSFCKTSVFNPAVNFGKTTNSWRVVATAIVARVAGGGRLTQWASASLTTQMRQC